MKSLAQRIDDAERVLTEVDTALAKDAALHSDITEALRQVTAHRSDMALWKGMIDARDAAMEYLVSADDEAGSSQDGLVAFGKNRIEFRHARLIGVEAYLSISWALADSITAVAGLVLCPAERGNNPARPAQLLSHFVNDSKGNDVGKSAPDAIAKSIRQSFGWPIVISYSIRNQFVHAGGQANGYSFFSEPPDQNRFQISNEAWDQIVKSAAACGLSKETYRDGPGWLDSPTDNLLVVLLQCECEIDSALGVLLGCACQALKSHVAFILDQD